MVHEDPKFCHKEESKPSAVPTLSQLSTSSWSQNECPLSEAAETLNGPHPSEGFYYCDEMS